MDNDLTEDEAQFASLFARGQALPSAERRAKRIRAERRTQLTDRQRSRGGRQRNVQLNLRTTQEVRDRVDGLCDKLGLSVMDLIELAVAELAKARGV